ncbi:unnamed protein product [Leptidea sinapis]|uniref:Invertebrate defensins family profile domain-containing protein n=1 Tax=Leptidea sinapis TaxID=189913 RepID=A0A5E4PX76_9NEOP|nr:unnamed protein product [Leptidea sinapis]
MKTSVVIAFLFVAILFVTSIQAVGEESSNNHILNKRQILKKDVIFMKPPPGCIFYECIAKCRQRGNKNGGYCTINGCVCVR